MKPKIRLYFLLFFLFALLTNCENEPVIPEEENLVKTTIEKVKVDDDQILIELLNKTIGNINYRVGSTLSTKNGDVDLSEAIKVTNPEKDIIRYSLAIRSTQANFIGFDNLIVRAKGDAVNSYILRYEPSIDWLLNI